ncbi:MAG: ribonuclease III [Candidatus Colwellbacteria bacterium]|nr:ribonuclease III [Candidatus Colwellbacteria bacterium]
MKQDLDSLQQKIGIKFKNNNLLKEALTHRSYLNENPSWPHDNNERLEFLGDAVLELVMTEELYHLFPDKEEGELTIYRAGMVNTKNLAAVAEEISLAKQILLSRGETKSFAGRSRESISADAVEALIGAIYLDQGYASAKKFIQKLIIPRLDKVTKGGGKDPKSSVQEIAQSRHKITPAYKVLHESGPAHERIFRVGLYFGEELKAEGQGNSKQEAETEAAKKLLHELREL